VPLGESEPFRETASAGGTRCLRSAAAAAASMYRRCVGGNAPHRDGPMRLSTVGAGRRRCWPAGARARPPAARLRSRPASRFLRAMFIVAAARSSVGPWSYVRHVATAARAAYQAGRRHYEIGRARPVGVPSIDPSPTARYYARAGRLPAGRTRLGSRVAASVFCRLST